jgi:hypothetical protein
MSDLFKPSFLALACALTASVALMLGLGFGYLIPTESPAGSADPDWQLLASHLKTADSLHCRQTASSLRT